MEMRIKIDPFQFLLIGWLAALVLLFKTPPLWLFVAWLVYAVALVGFQLFSILRSTRPAKLRVITPEQLEACLEEAFEAMESPGTRPKRKKLLQEACDIKDNPDDFLRNDS